MIIIISLVVLVVLLIVEFANWVVLGSFIKDKDLKLFMEKKFPTYFLNPYCESILSGGDHFIAKSSISLFSKWYMDGVGRIPRWSKYNKVISKRQKELSKSARQRALEEFESN